MGIDFETVKRKMSDVVITMYYLSTELRMMSDADFIRLLEKCENIVQKRWAILLRYFF